MKLLFGNKIKSTLSTHEFVNPVRVGCVGKMFYRDPDVGIFA
jgi:hypothetical protein